MARNKNNNFGVILHIPHNKKKKKKNLLSKNVGYE